MGRKTNAYLEDHSRRNNWRNTQLHQIAAITGQHHSQPVQRIGGLMKNRKNVNTPLGQLNGHSREPSPMAFTYIRRNNTVQPNEERNVRHKAPCTAKSPNSARQ